MRKIALLFCLFSLAFCASGFAQTAPDSAFKINPYRNSVYVEAFGNGILPTLNYERLVWFPASETTIAFRVGGLFIPTGMVENKLEYEMIMPFEITFFGGKRNVKFETGFGVSFYQNSYTYLRGTGEPVSDKSKLIFPVFRLGARWQQPGKPLLFRAGFTPLFLGDDNFLPPVLPFFGLSVGYSFGRKKS